MFTHFREKIPKDIYERYRTYLQFQVETKGIVEPEVQAYAAGYLEGVLSRTLINYYIHNMYEPYCRNHTQFCGRLDAFLGENQVRACK